MLLLLSLSLALALVIVIVLTPSIILCFPCSSAVAVLASTVGGDDGGFGPFDADAVGGGCCADGVVAVYSHRFVLRIAW